MKTIRKDDRTLEQIFTHRFLVTATDHFLSGWGDAKGGLSKCAWACDNNEDMKKVFDWVQKRGDMDNVRYHFSNHWYPEAAHVQIYVVGKNHRALKVK